MSEQVDFSLATQALQAAPFGVLILDSNKCVRWLNKMAEEFLDVEAEHLIGQGRDTLPSDDLDEIFEPKEILSIPMGSGTRWLKCWHLPLRIDNEITGEIYFYIDITEYRQVQAERDQLAEDLSRQSVRDPLTGLPNRRGLMQGLEPQVSRSRRYQNPLSIIRLQIDDLDQMDNRYGATTTDRVVLTIGHMLRDQTRWADLIGRFDADEFILVLPETTKGTAVRLAEKFCKWVRDQKIVAVDGSEISAISRCGVTEYIKGDDTAKLMRRANKALQSIKHSTDSFVSVL